MADKIMMVILPDGRKFEMPDVKENREYYAGLNKNANSEKEKVKIEKIEESKEIEESKGAVTPRRVRRPQQAQGIQPVREPEAKSDE